MKRSVKISLIVGACLMVLGILLILFTLPISIKEFQMNKEEIQISVAEIHQPFHSVELYTESEDIRIEIGNTASVSYRDHQNISHSVLVEDGVLKLRREDHRKWYEHIGIDFYSGDLVLTLPAEAYQRLQLETISGDLTVSAGFTFTQTDLTTVSGDLLINSLQGDLLQAETTSGEIELNRVVLQTKIQLQSVSGDLELEACDAPDLYLGTTSGDIEAELLSRKKFLVTTVSGEVEVPPSFESREVCTVETTSGDISIETEIIG